MWPRNDKLNITDIKWERSISIEEERTVDESDWNLPSNARLHYTKEEILQARANYEVAYDKELVIK